MAVVILLIMITKNLDAQEFPEGTLSLNRYTAGLGLSIKNEFLVDMPIAFIYGYEIYEINNGIFKIITFAGDTLNIEVIQRINKQKEEVHE